MQINGNGTLLRGNLRGYITQRLFRNRRIADGLDIKFGEGSRRHGRCPIRLARGAVIDAVGQILRVDVFEDVAHSDNIRPLFFVGIIRRSRNAKIFLAFYLAARTAERRHAEHGRHSGTADDCLQVARRNERVVSYRGYTLAQIYRRDIGTAPERVVGNLRNIEDNACEGIATAERTFADGLQRLRERDIRQHSAVIECLFADAFQTARHIDIDKCRAISEHPFGQSDNPVRNTCAF